MEQEVTKELDGSSEVSQIIEKAILDCTEVCSVHRRLLFSRTRQEDVCIARFFLYTILRNAGFTWTHIGRVTERDHGAAYMGAQRLEMRLLCKEKHLLNYARQLTTRGWTFKENFNHDN